MTKPGPGDGLILAGLLSGLVGTVGLAGVWWGCVVLGVVLAALGIWKAT